MREKGRGKLKLNLGCGKDKREGYVNVDVDPGVRPDVVTDLRERLPFEDESAREILLQDVLEHLTPIEGRKLLGECFRILEKGGKIRVRVPNVKRIWEQFGGDEEVASLFLYGNIGRSERWGGHKTGYSKEQLATELMLMGFEELKVGEEETNWVAEAKRSKGLLRVSRVTVILQDAVAMGGAEFLMLHLAKEWEKRGVEAKVFTILRELIGRFKLAGLAANYIPFRMDVVGGWKGAVKFFLFLPLALVYYFNLLKQEKKSGSELVLMSGFSDKIVVTPLARVLGLPVVWIEYGPLSEIFRRNLFLPKILYRLVKGLPERVITLSESTKRSLIRDAKISEAKMVVVPGGVEEVSVTRLRQMKQGGKILRRKWGVRGKVVVGNLGRVCMEKGQEELVEAFVATRAAKEEKAVLMLAGEGPGMESLQAVVDKLGLGEKVKILGWVEERWEFLGALDVFVFPSRWELEGFGLVTCEAMMAALPVIGFAVGPTPEIVVGGETGILVKNKEEMSEAIDKLVNDATLRGRLGREGRKVAVAKYGVGQFAEKMEKVLLEARARNEARKFLD